MFDTRIINKKFVHKMYLIVSNNLMLTNPTRKKRIDILKGNMSFKLKTYVRNLFTNKY